MPLIRWAPLPQCSPPPDVEKFGVPNAGGECLEWNPARGDRGGALDDELARIFGADFASGPR